MKRTVLLVSLLGGRVFAQTGELSPIGLGPNGAHIYGASVSGGYSTLPAYFGGLATTAQSGYDVSGSLSMGYSHFSELTAFTLTYVPNFYRNISSRQDVFNESLV